MLKSNYLKLLAAIAGLALVTAAGAQVLIGGFQGASDPTDAGWINPNDSGASITTDTNCSFLSGVVPSYAQSLSISGGTNNAGSFGYPSLELQFSPAQIAAFNANSWITFTFSVPAGTYTSGYSQVASLALNAPGYKYNNLSWANAQEMGNTNATPPGTFPNFYFGGSDAEQTMVVTMNYSSVTNAIIAGGEGYLQMTLQGNQGDGAPVNWYINNVVLSTGPFGQNPIAPALSSSEFIVDNFSPNGVGPSNPTNDDYYTYAANYTDGQITNVWGNWFGSAFSNVVWAAGMNPTTNAAEGSLEINADFTPDNIQFEVWDQGATNNYYALSDAGFNGLLYTNFECDVMFAPGSATNSAGTFGDLQFGDQDSYGQDYIGGVTIPASEAGQWVHVSIPVSALNDTHLVSPNGGLLIHIYDTTINGAMTLYVDNLEFTGPTVAPSVVPTVLDLQNAVPGLRMFVGDSATYVREGVITTQGSGEQESWVSGASYPVNYSFQLLSYPANNIGVTELAILPEASFNPTANSQTTIYNNPFLDYQDSNGLYVTIAPYSGNGSVTATVQWKVGLPSASPTNTVLTVTNSTALGTWTLTMNSATSGSLTPPGGSPQNFLPITDPNVSSDFANPAVVVVAEDPNSAAGYGLYEDYGTISITGVASGNQIENFSDETNDFSNGTSPGGYFQNNYSVDPKNLIISRVGLDKYWIHWNQTANLGLTNLVTSTNVFTSVTNWLSPTYYSQYADQTPPRGLQIALGTTNWVLLPTDDLPTHDGNYQQDSPAINNMPINDALAPDAYFMLTTNAVTPYPLIY